MAVRIDSITKNSRAEALGIESGDILVSINGHEIIDGLDYRFYETESHLDLVVLDEYGKEHEFKIRKGTYEPIGFEFNSYLIDKERSCRNKCIFCFIDQLPKGMRDTLYFKDDDSRLSFLFGNYITLTNIDEREINRIISMHISPINISVHTMNPDLRCRMMNNRFAGEKLKYIKVLTEGGIKINCQLVLCPGFNDGEELKFTLSELSKLGENLQSIACVPVGLTKYREGLEKLVPFNEKTAAEVIDIIENFGENMLKERDSRVAFPSDEFYLIAKRELPPYEFYEDFPQIENGVGMFRDLEDEFLFALEDYIEDAKKASGKVTIATGEGIYPLLNSLLDELRNKCDNLYIDLVPVKNNFFGGTVDVTGLLTGQDIIEQLKNRDLGDALILSECMLKADEDIFLDDVKIEDVAENLKVKVIKCKNGGENLIKTILNKDSI